MFLRKVVQILYSKLKFQLKVLKPKVNLISFTFSTGVELFDHIAGCLAEFVDEFDLQDVTLPLGFTFSFPCQQEGLAKVGKTN